MTSPTASAHSQSEEPDEEEPEETPPLRGQRGGRSLGPRSDGNSAPPTRPRPARLAPRGPMRAHGRRGGSSAAGLGSAGVRWILPAVWAWGSGRWVRSRSGARGRPGANLGSVPVWVWSGLGLGPSSGPVQDQGRELTPVWPWPWAQSQSGSDTVQGLILVRGARPRLGASPGRCRLPPVHPWPSGSPAEWARLPSSDPAPRQRSLSARSDESHRNAAASCPHPVPAAAQPRALGVLPAPSLRWAAGGARTQRPCENQAVPCRRGQLGWGQPMFPGAEV